MKIVADENMPLVQEYFSEYGEVVSLAGRQMSHKDVVDADILLVRSVTNVNRELLHDSKVKFVATATIGVDHLDKNYLDDSNIVWTSAPGCNADSVAEYDVTMLAYLYKTVGFDVVGKKVGIIGCGNVGSRVVKRLEILGANVLSYDPPKAENDSEFESVELEDLYDCDVLCLHAPLTKSGSHSSYHMIGESFFENLNKEAYIISAGRGPVIDFKSLAHLDLKKVILDVWEPEPNIDLEIMNQCLIATPHVAGYSLQSKWRGTEMVYCEAAKTFGWKVNKKVRHPVESPSHSIENLGSWQDCVLSLYNPKEDSERTLRSMNHADDTGIAFDMLRKTYPLRHEFFFPKVRDCGLIGNDLEICKALGFDFIK